MINFKGVFLNVSESSSEGLMLGNVMTMNFMLVLSNIDELDS